MWTELLNNLTNIGYAMLIFICAYLANMAFSLWYNVKILNQNFDKEKITASVLKILVFVVGLTLLCISITALPIFANQVGWTIPDEYTEVFANIVIISAVLLVSAKYIKEAYKKFIAILNTNNDIAGEVTAQGATDEQEQAEGVVDTAAQENATQTATDTQEQTAAATDTTQQEAAEQPATAV
jgi:hypothetical protein